MSATSAVSARYAGRRVVVLGASGFLGSHLVERLVRYGSHVVAFARGSATAALPAMRGARVVLGDVRRHADVAGVVRGGDIVFAMAGRSGAAASMRDPVQSLDVNLGGLLTLLAVAAALDPRPRIVFPGSRLQYGPVDTVPVAESAPLRPNSVYGLHKTQCEEQLAFFERIAGVPYAVARITNPYGPGAGDPAKPYNVLAALMLRGLDGESLSVYGEGSQLRDYVHIDDVIDALLLLGLLDAPATVVNVGSGRGIAFSEAVRTIARACDVPVTHVPWPPAEAAVETGDFVADVRRLGDLGWRARVPFEDGVDATIATLRAAS